MSKINRRTFIQSASVLGGAALVSSAIGGPFFKPGISNQSIVSIPGDDPMQSVPRLLEHLGGIRQFVPAGSSVGFLVNSPWKHAGYFTNPDVVLAMVKLCAEAGASEIVVFKPTPKGYWEKSRYFDQMLPLIEKFTYCSDRIDVAIPEGKMLNKAELFKGFMDVDVFINIPVAKHHNGTLFSGNLKNMMGVSSSYTNRHMHSPDGEYSYDKHEYLAQCIADLNLVRKPDLCLVDAIVCAQNNGPRGPGDTTAPNRILAGTDPVAMDVYSAGLIGMFPEDILTVEYAAGLGIGKLNPQTNGILEL